MKKEDRIYEMQKLAYKKLNEKYNLNLQIWDLITSDIYDDGTNLMAIYEVKSKKSIYELDTIYYVRAYFTDKKAHIFSCDKFVKENNQ